MTDKHKGYVVRFSHEFSLYVEASNKDDAIKKAEKVPEDQWDKITYAMEAELEFGEDEDEE